MKRTLAQDRKRNRQKGRLEPPLAGQENAALQVRPNPDDKEIEHEEFITYDDYIKEREHLSKYEAANYENYEKQILTLAAAFLAFPCLFWLCCEINPPPS